MKIVLDTQHRENYGAHDWSGTGACPQYWKSKGGTTYVMENVTVEQSQDKAFWDSFRSAVTSCSDAFAEYVIGENLLDDCEDVPCEDWEAPYVCADESTMEFVSEELDGHMAAPVTGVRRIMRANTQGKLEAEGVQYQIAGEWVSYKEGREAVAAYRATQEQTA